MRYPAVVVAVSALLVLVPQSLSAQSASTPPATTASSAVTFHPSWTPHPVRDEKAIQTIQAAVNALGGTAVITAAQNWIVQAQTSPAPGWNRASGTVTWTISGAEYRYDYTAAQGTVTVASGHGKPFNILNGTVGAIPSRTVRAAFALPLVAVTLANELQDANYSLQYDGDANVGATPVTVIKTSSQANPMDVLVTPQTWYFDNSNLPVRVEYRLPDMKVTARFMHGTLDLSNYQPVSSVLYPTQIVRSIGGKPFETLTLLSVQTNTNINASVFDAPGGAQ